MITSPARMAGDRFCPLCDAYLAVELCPAHGVPTIAKFEAGDELVKLDVGTVLAGRYRVERFLRSGGMGVVLLARHLNADRPVVLKVLKNDRLAMRTNLRRFYQEARVITRLQHPNIVRVFEFGFDAPSRVPFLAMELVEGRTLREIVRSDGPMPEERCAAILSEVARALVEAHDKGVLHRDLKPANIMVVALADGGEDVKVLDFGLAKVLDPDDGTKPLTAPGQAVGTPAFMAPEQITQGPQDFRTDLYGLGCVMHVMLTGSPPFDSPERLEAMRRQLREPPPPLPAQLADGRAPTAPLIALHKKLLMKNRTDRPASTVEVMALLDKLAARTETAELRTETMEAMVEPMTPALPNRGIPEAKTLREEVITQPEVEAFRSGTSSVISAASLSEESGESSTRLLADSFDVGPTMLRDPSERAERRENFAEEEEAWTSVLPSSMESEGSGTTPLAMSDSGDKPELPVHDLRKLGAVPNTVLTPAGSTTPIAPRSGTGVAAIVDLPVKTRPTARDLERRILFAIALASLLAILLSLIALVARDEGTTKPPATEGRR